VGRDRRRGRTPAWLLDALVSGRWAGPWDVDVYASEDGSDAVTVRRDGRWYTGHGPTRGSWGHLRRPIDWSAPGVAGLRIFANPPFRLWSVAGLGALHGMRRDDGPAQVTLVGLDDRSTELGRALHRAERGCRSRGAGGLIRRPGSSRRRPTARTGCGSCGGW
jgi:hypothetical protein